jgi:hypothetical protein
MVPAMPVTLLCGTLIAQVLHVHAHSLYLFNLWIHVARMHNRDRVPECSADRHGGFGGLMCVLGKG